MTPQTMRATLSMLLVMPLVSSVAFAQTAPGEPQAVSATAAPAPRVGAEDPNVDRGFLLPTAMTQPAGSVTYNNYELLLHGLTYGITDNVQATLTVLPPLVSEMPLIGFGAIKGRLPVGERIHLAAQGSVGFARSARSSSTDDTVYIYGAGAFASLCLVRDCSSLASASVTYQHSLNTGGASDGNTIIYGGSLVTRVGQYVKLLLEVTSAAGGAGDQDISNIPGFLAGYGVRFHTDNIAADVGFVRPFGEDTSEFVMGLPFASVSYRWQ